jgi:hypothetical protein
VKRYESEKLWSMGPVDGFIIHTPDDRQLIDTHPQTIVRELNRLNVEIEEKRKDVVYLATEKAKLENCVMRLEEAGDAVAAIIGPPGSAHWADENQVDAAWNNWTKAKEAK